MKSFIFLLVLITNSSNLFAYTKGKVYKLTLLHTNDHHGRFWPNKDGEYGLAARLSLINTLREEIKRDGGQVLLLDAGDVNTGVPQSDLQDAEPDFKGMAKLGYDVMALGNHEFDKPLSTIFKQRKWAGFPFISANIYCKNTKRRIFPSHIKKEMGDLKVTIFGLTTEDTSVKSNPKNTANMLFVPAIEEAKKIVPLLKQKTDVLIALTHMGHYINEAHGSDAPGDVSLARQVNGIDVIIGGHTQKPLFQPDIQNGSIIVQAHEWGKYVGRVDLEFLDGKLSLIKSELIPVNLKDSNTRILPDLLMEEFLRPYKEKGDSTLLVELGSADELFLGGGPGRLLETNLGNLVTRAYKDKFKADLALTNSGGLRDSIYPGVITYESVLTALPFAGEVGTVELKGSELLTYLEYIVFNMNPGSGSFPQLSGVEITASKEAKKIKTLLINGKELSLDQKYTLALPEFVAGGGDKYPKLDFKKYGFIDATILKEFIQQHKTIKNSDYAARGYLKFEQ